MGLVLFLNLDSCPATAAAQPCSISSHHWGLIAGCRPKCKLSSTDKHSSLFERKIASPCHVIRYQTSWLHLAASSQWTQRISGLQHMNRTKRYPIKVSPMFRNTLPGLVVFTVLVSGNPSLRLLRWVFCIANQASIYYINSCPVSPPIRVLMSNSYRVKIPALSGLPTSEGKLQCFSVRSNPALSRVVHCFHSGHLARKKQVNTGDSNNTNRGCYPFRTKRIQMLLLSAGVVEFESSLVLFFFNQVFFNVWILVFLLWTVLILDSCLFPLLGFSLRARPPLLYVCGKP